MNKSKIGAAITGLALALACGSAAAEVTFDPATGTGFVGKGDVQTPFGYNNHVMQTRHEAITFTFVSLEQKTQACASNDRGTFTVVGYRTKSQGMLATVAADNRKKMQFVGWNLLGWDGDPVVEETDWSEGPGNGCPTGSNPHGAPEIVELHGLYAADLGTSHLIWSE